MLHANFRRRYAALGFVVILLLALASGTVFFESRLVHAGGTGGEGSSCVPAPGQPACRFSGFNATASASFGGDASNCMLTTVSVFAGEHTSHTPPGAPTDSASVSVSIFSFDVCTFTFLSDSFGGALADIKVTGQLGTAVVTATVPISDPFNGTSDTVTVNLTWKGIGPVSSTMDSQHIRTGHFRLDTRQTGDSRLATVAGTVAGSATTYTLNTTSTMFSSTGGTVAITQQ